MSDYRRAADLWGAAAREWALGAIGWSRWAVGLAVVTLAYQLARLVFGW